MSKEILNTGLRPSTNAGIAAVLSFFVLWILGYFAPAFLDAAPGDPEMTGGMITALFMWGAARLSRVPERVRKWL